ncbi:MAG: CpXC domain-containing protein [Eubacteriales bacterium]|nr:CpXC domain-containing protein [Eubacteriales bacterium]
MSLETSFHQVLAQCPVCLNEETLTIWDVIDASTDPDLREKLLRKTLQSLDCRNCGNATLIASPLTYLDPDHGLQIECRPDLSPADLENRLSQLRQSPELAGELSGDSCLRLVCSMNDLIEKIHVREQQLDDQVLEIVKLAVLRHGSTESPIEELRFVGAAGDELSFVIRNGEGWFQYALPGQAYDNAAQLLDRLTDTGLLTELEDDTTFMLIDQTFAARCLDAFTAAETAPEEA